MLFTTVEEIRKHHHVLFTFSMDAIIPYLRKVEKEYILPAISEIEYDNLQSDYDAFLTGTPLPAKSAKLLDEVRDALAPLVIHYYMPFAQGKAGQNGIFITDNDEQVPAPKWMIDRMMATALENGMKAIDHLYEFLEKRQNIYTDWAASESYTIFKSSFINSVKEFEKHIKIGNSRRTFLAMQPIIQRVEFARFESALSYELFTEIKEQIEDDGLSAANKKLLERYIRPALAHLTMSEAILDLPLTLDEKGVMLYEEEKKSVSLDQKQVYAAKRANQGENDLTDLQHFLYQHAEDYPAFMDSDRYNPNGGDYFENESGSGIAGML
jgi:hypothetical protein